MAANRAKRERLRNRAALSNSSSGLRRAEKLKNSSVLPLTQSEIEQPITIAPPSSSSSPALLAGASSPSERLSVQDSALSDAPHQSSRLFGIASSLKHVLAISSSVAPMPGEGSLRGNLRTFSGSAKSHLSEYQELAILASGGLIETIPESLLRVSAKNETLPPI